MCSTDVYCSNKPAAVAPKETITHHFFVSELGRRKLSMQPKFVAAQKMLLNRKPSNIRKMDCLGFTLGIYTAGKRVCIAQGARLSCPSIWATLSALLINILLGSFQLFLHSDQPLSEGEIIPFSGVCQSGRPHYPRRRRWWLHALTDRLLWCATDDDQRQHHHAEHHFQL